MVEQRLEQVIVVAIDDQDVKRCLRQLLGHRKSTESRSDNYDLRGSGMVGSHFKVTSVGVDLLGLMRLPEYRRLPWRHRAALGWRPHRVWERLRSRSRRPLRRTDQPANDGISGSQKVDRAGAITTSQNPVVAPSSRPRQNGSWSQRWAFPPLCRQCLDAPQRVIQRTSPSENHIPGCDQHVRAVNNGRPDCESIDLLSSR